MQLPITLLALLSAPVAVELCVLPAASAVSTIAVVEASSADHAPNQGDQPAPAPSEKSEKKKPTPKPKPTPPPRPTPPPTPQPKPVPDNCPACGMG